MKDSTSNGMNWFEGIIPEVNDIMLQGTFKYVENHVNNVGGTLKKLCSDVVQDFLPPSVDSVNCEAEELVPEEGAATSTFTENNSGISIENFFPGLLVEKSPVVIDEIDHEKSTDVHEDSLSELAKWKVNEEHFEESSLDELIRNSGDNSDRFKTVGNSGSGLVLALTNRNSDFVIDENAIKESTDDSELNFPSVAESIETSLIDESIETNNEMDYVEKQQLDHVYLSVEHLSLDYFGNAKSIHIDDVNFMKESLDGESELTSPDVNESSKASYVDGLTKANYENECMFSVNVALPTTVQNSLENEQCSEALYDIIVDDAECYFDSSTNSSLSNSTSLPTYSSDVLSRFLSSTPASAVSINEEELRKQLIPSCTLLPLKSTGKGIYRKSEIGFVRVLVEETYTYDFKQYSDVSNADVSDSCMENIDLCDEMKLSESCVLVDDSTLRAISRRARKLESYKKKIQNIFASKKRLAKEYEQLAIWFGDADINSSQDSSSDSHNQQTRHARDSEWELL
ncbi:hypothetical protein F8388_000419 [Cannabis sativa]|uniref:Uncharacterized protein n=1 Tax=Cannabis sativa TaxID=3483 RepID=A0A7J6HHM2_CANSA|nr:hypothetical protein F8388_000419 [Cannabis sativa]KAF4394029.1 hypothetical protein G4B88_025998 [Cannabis sativa]